MSIQINQAEKLRKWTVMKILMKALTTLTPTSYLLEMSWMESFSMESPHQHLILLREKFSSFFFIRGLISLNMIDLWAFRPSHNADITKA